MEDFKDFLETIIDEEQKDQIGEVLDWIKKKFPELEEKIGWKQPMFTDHDTYIIGLSVAKNNFAIGPEKYALDIFKEEILRAGYECTQQLIKVKWNQKLDYGLLEKIIKFKIEDKKDYTAFWHK